jgi:hypothetical protein
MHLNLLARFLRQSKHGVRPGQLALILRIGWLSQRRSECLGRFYKSAPLRAIACNGCKGSTQAHHGLSIPPRRAWLASTPDMGYNALLPITSCLLVHRWSKLMAATPWCQPPALWRVLRHGDQLMHALNPFGLGLCSVSCRTCTVEYKPAVNCIPTQLQSSDTLLELFPRRVESLIESLFVLSHFCSQ